MTVAHPPDMSAEACRLCGAMEHASVLNQARDYITGERFDVIRCTECGVAFTAPQPSTLYRFYPLYYRQYSRLTGALLRFLYNRRARSWVRTLGPSGVAMEVGCGDGWMLHALREQGWTVMGNERTIQSSLVAAKVNGLPMFVGGFDAVKRQPRFDLIILFQVLEHMPEPLKTLLDCSALLKPGGVLMVSVPNLESWQARVTGDAWFHLDVPRHLFHFSARSLSETLRRIGLVVRRRRFVSFEHDPFGWEQSLLNLLGFPQNLLTSSLMGMNRRAILSPSGLAMVLVGGVLLIPSLALALVSWVAGSGAIVELMAVKPSPEAGPIAPRIQQPL